MKSQILTVIATVVLAGCGSQSPSVDLWTAAAIGNTDAILEHIAYGTDLDEKEQLGGSTPLIVAAVYGQTDAAELLVENGASLNAVNNHGSTALHSAAFFCRLDTVAWLLDQGADIDVRNDAGATALDAVAGEWGPELEDLYTMLGNALQIDVDFDRLRAARPKVAELIRQHGG